MDFLRNPVGNDRMKPFDLQDLDDEARMYLERAGAVQKLPIERLAHMNPMAIDIYQENGIDLFTEPLEIAVCASTTTGAFRSIAGGSPASPVSSWSAKWPVRTASSGPAGRPLIPARPGGCGRPSASLTPALWSRRRCERIRNRRPRSNP